MADRLPLFPLSTVLFPGLVLPLQIFEERYRILLAELLARPEPDRVFGVVAIRLGREAGAPDVGALYDVGCTAVVRSARERPDGMLEIVTTGAERFALHAVHHDRPYLTGTVETLADPPHDAQTERWNEVVRMAYQDYLSALRQAGAAVDELPELPADALALSYLVAASVQVDLPVRQALLAAPEAGARLRDELVLLRRESRLLRALGALPAPDLARAVAHPN